MGRRKILLYIGVTITAAVVAVFAFIAVGNQSAPHPEPTPSPLVTRHTGDGPKSGSSATPHDPSFDGSEGLAPGEHDENIPMMDLSAFQQKAIDMVTAFATFTTDETVDARQARLAAVAGEGSPIITKVTELALSRHDESVDWSARSGVVGRPYAGYSSETSDSYTFNVVADYWGSYGTPETQSQQARGTYIVTIAVADDSGGAPKPGRVLSIKEPEYLLR